jgi:hypothetical protein
LIFAGTETSVHVSFDGGDHWQSLQLNLPTSSVRDLTVHGDDLVAATFGRALWILDNLSPLRQLDKTVATANAYLYRPATALRVRWDNHQETPLPADTPAGQNPPDGAIIDYYLKANSASEVTLEIRDEQGKSVRRYSSMPPTADTLPGNAPDYWFAPPEVLSTKAGLHRFVWNLQYPHPATLPYSFYGQRLNYIEYTLPDHAIPGQTPRNQPPGPLVVPGKYEVVLTVDGKTYRQPLVVSLDPRVRVAPGDLEAQLDLAKQFSESMAISYQSYNEVALLRAGLAERLKSLAGNSSAKGATDAATTLAKELGPIQDGTNAAPGFGTVNRDLARYLTMIEGGDQRPAPSASENGGRTLVALTNNLERWRKINAENVPALNKLLAQYQIAALPMLTPGADPASGK